MCDFVRFDNVRFILMVLGIDLVAHDKAEKSFNNFDTK
jgi:hypothetical protein